MFNDIGNAFQEGIVDADKLPELLLFSAFLITFGFIRTSTHMIRAGVSWWPGNVETKGGLHIHHMVFGIIGMLIIGYAAIAFYPDPPVREVMAVLFGICMALTLDEFALWLNLKDVYWSKQGRQSIDAVIIAAAVGALLLLGVRVFADVADELEKGTKAVVATIGVLGVMVAFANVLKGKFGMAMAGLLIPFVGLIGVLRLGKPHSVWARTYGPKRRARAGARFSSA
ncbi:MAG: hypothetical protein H0V29_04395 [Thermoleophilaceae bacterium]|nr:hypothetical protein [Thermoleophilaceae bacterium]